MLRWEEITYFGKGIILGTVLWIILSVFLLARELYLTSIIQQMQPKLFYLFYGEINFFYVILYGIGFVFLLGAIGWMYGRIIGERV